MTLYSFSHYLQVWLLPPGVNILLCVVGFFMITIPSVVDSKNRTLTRVTGKLLVYSGFLSLWLLSTPFIAYNLTGILQNQYTLLSLPAKPEKNAAIVVLGGGSTVAAEFGNKIIPSDPTLHRINYAAFLHQQLHLPIITTGGKALPSLPSDAKIMADTFQTNYHIPVNILEEESFTTADESKLMLPILKQHHIETIYLVTNAWHMPRSVFIFQCKGIHIIPAPMGYFVYGPGFGLISFLPNIQALLASSVAIHEFIGLAWYHLKYGNTCHDDQNNKLANA